MLRTLLFCVLLLLRTTTALAQAWPVRPVHLIVPFPAGGGTDIVARVLAGNLSEMFRQQFVVENRPGASGMIGTGVVAKANADGYTFLVGSPAETALAPSLFKAMNYAPLKDLVPVTLLAWTHLVLAAHPSFSASSPQELIELARHEPIDFSTPGIGSTHHLTGEYLNAIEHLKLVHVPYRGAAPAVTDAVGGQVKLTISGMPPVVPFLKANALKAIAVTSKQRFPLYPDIPALAEIKSFENFDSSNWFGLLAPAGTPTDVIDRIQKAVVQALKDARVQQVLTNQAAVPVGNTPAEFGDFIGEEAKKYARIVAVTQVQVQLQ
jgi:tripartite-type tricarboxylate transporter receptor subunit TctC